MNQRRPDRRCLFSVTRAMAIRGSAVDASIRETFRTLLDEVDVELQKRGLDHDVVEHERIVNCRSETGVAFAVPAEPLSDLQQFILQIVKHSPDEHACADNTDVVEAEVRVWHDDWSFFPH